MLARPIPGAPFFLHVGRALVVWLVAEVSILAQPLATHIGDPPASELSPPQVDVISGATAARLEQATTLAAAKLWDEATDILRDVAAENAGRLVDLHDGRFVTAGTYCQLQLTRLPAEGLAVYRRRVDPLAERWYREGISRRDEPLLTRVANDLFCSSWGDDALAALGELALERADYAAARRYWEQISPLLRDPAGRSLWLALRNIELGAHWPEIERRWNQRPKPPSWLAFPDTSLELVDVRARLVLTSIRAGELDRAQLELDVFRRLHSNATGRLAGQEGPYVTLLERLLQSAAEWPDVPPSNDWPTFAGATARAPTAQRLGPITGPAWAQPVQLVPIGINAGGRSNRRDPLAGDFERDSPIAAVRDSELPPSCFPVAIKGIVLYQDGAGIGAADLITGRPVVTDTGRIHAEERAAGPRGVGIVRFGGGLLQGLERSASPNTLSIIDNVVYAHVGRLLGRQVEPTAASASDRLIGLDLSRDGVLKFRIPPGEGGWAFDGAPVGDGRRLFASMRHSEVMPHAHVACFDAATGRQLWLTPIGAADMPPSESGVASGPNLLTLAGDRIYANTNLGLVAAVDAGSGEICWIHRYERRSSKHTGPGVSGPPNLGRRPVPCLYHNGLIVVAPTDTPRVFALDAETGQALWSTDLLPDAQHLLGIVRNNLIVSGNRLWAIDVNSGKVRFAWPESDTAGLRGMGRGLVAGDEVFWPTRREIYVIHGVTGARTRRPINLGSISESGANLAAAGRRLIVAGGTKLMAFGAALPVPPNSNQNQAIEPIASRE